MLNLTNHEADHLARRAEKGAHFLRELVAHHRQMQDAMHVIGEETLETYHRSMAALVTAAAVNLETDAADLRERRKPHTPDIPADLHVGHPRPDRAEQRRRLHAMEGIEKRA